MTKTEFLRELEGQLEISEGGLNNEDQMLATLSGWDSMAAVIFIALADEKLGVLLPDNQIASAKSVGDLMALLGGRLTD